MNVRNITILGSTGSIGTQALDVIRRHPDKLKVHALVCHHNADLLIKQAHEFKPNVVVINDEQQYKYLKNALKDTGIEILSGRKAINEVAASFDADIVLTAMVGFSGLEPTIKAIETGRTIALANKETLVVAGEMIMKHSRKHVAPILPVDSEHSAVFQSLQGEDFKSISKIYLTASGGPFVDMPADELMNVTPEAALKHPKWHMGQKVTIDSATLMNKGLEMIEAKWLFDLSPEEIEIVVHRQSIVHSMIGFKDGSVKAQLSYPDMRLPIAYALMYPHRYDIELPLLKLEDISALTFETPRIKDFPCLSLAYEALESGGTAPCIMNAANEVAVEKFINQEIRFTEIPKVIRATMDAFGVRAATSLDYLREVDLEARAKARKWCRS